MVTTDFTARIRTRMLLSEACVQISNLFFSDILYNWYLLSHKQLQLKRTDCAAISFNKVINGQLTMIKCHVRMEMKQRLQHGA